MDLEIARKTRDIGDDSLRLTTLRQQSGAATALDVHQAEQLLRTATAQIAASERSIAQQENVLSVLVGKTPGDIPVDSNELIALCAPRLTFISYGIPEKGDAHWLDHEGSFMATVDASRVFTLLAMEKM